MSGLYVSTKQPLRKVELILKRSFVGREVLECEDSLKSYGFNRSRQVRPFIELVRVLLIVGLWAVGTWFVAHYFEPEPKALNWKLEPVSWANAVSLGVAIILYRQWRLARYEISIDKYYDRIDSANKRLEALHDKEGTEVRRYEAHKDHKYNMHVFAELDLLEYVIFKYYYGFISPVLAARAANNFKKLCQNQNHAGRFDEEVAHWVVQAGYTPETRLVVGKIRESNSSDTIGASS